MKSTVAQLNISGLRLANGVVGADLAARIRERLLDKAVHGVSDIVMNGERRRSPRLTSSFSDSPLYMDGMSPSLPWTSELAELRDRIAGGFDLSFNYALANLYRDGRDHTGWHCDKSSLHVPGSIIAIASFGAPRTFAIREIGSREDHRFVLEDSSVLLMGLGLQRTHEHSVVVEEYDVGMRLSVTLRNIHILPEYLDGARECRR